MIEFISKLTERFNVCGCEHDLISFLAENANGTPCKTSLGNLYFTRKANCPEAKTVMISTQVDVPGFIALSSDEKGTNLVNLGNVPLDGTKQLSLIDKDGTLFKATVNDDKRCVLEGLDKSIGTVFRIKPNLNVDNETIIGFKSSVYALIGILCKLSTAEFPVNVIVHFATQGESKARSELSTALQVKPDLCILLGAAESENNKPLFLLKNGKHVASKKIQEKIENSIDNEVKTELCDTAVTKAEDLAKFGFDALSLAIPVKNKGKQNEEVSLSAIEKLDEAIKKLLMHR